jgi:hypothetical protein
MTIKGDPFVLSYLHSEENSPIDITVQPGHEFKLTCANKSPEYLNISERGISRQEHKANYLMSLHSASIFSGGDTSTIQFVTRSGSFTISPNVAYPGLGGVRLLSDSRIIYFRNCGHIGADHVQTFVFEDGLETPITAGIGRSQVAYATYVGEDAIYGKYSVGSTEQWRYHAFRFDLQTLRACNLGDDPVVCLAKDGSLLAEPEITDIKNDDYFTRWNHTIRIQRRDSMTTLQYHGQTYFPNCCTGGLFNIVQLTEHPDRKGYVPIDYESKVVKEIAPLIFDAIDIHELGDHYSFFIRLGRKDYVLLEHKSK